MGLTSRKKRPLIRQSNQLRDTKLFVIATEGEKTEKQYFSQFNSSRIQLKILHTEDSHSSPNHVLNRLESYVEEFQLGEEDELWLVVDVDRWGDKKLAQVCQACVQKNFHTAVSNPCFELWLCLHHVSASEFLHLGNTTCSYFDDRLRDRLGSYNRSQLDLSAFSPRISFAIEQAKQLHNDRSERWPSVLGSHVYKLIEKLGTVVST